MNLNHYILRNEKVVVVSLMEWARWMEVPGNKIIEQTKKGKILVSTIFLGLDYSWSEHGGIPILFETMISGGKHDQYQRRYATIEEAREGHNETLKMARIKRKDNKNLGSDFNEFLKEEGIYDWRTL